MNHWMLKTEPDECSLADIRRAGPSGLMWDGIRNYQARNFIRDGVAPGDRCFIFHSSCRQPGVYGVAEVLESPRIDPSQFDSSHRYFDANASLATPKWWCFPLAWQADGLRPVLSQWLKQQPRCQDWLLLRQPRLSISPLADADSQWLLAQMAKNRD